MGTNRAPTLHLRSLPTCQTKILAQLSAQGLLTLTAHQAHRGTTPFVPLAVLSTKSRCVACCLVASNSNNKQYGNIPNCMLMRLRRDRNMETYYFDVCKHFHPLAVKIAES